MKAQGDEPSKARYARMLAEGYGEHSKGRLEYLSDYVFDFTTYDSAMATLFARRALEVCAAISNETTYEYIKDPEQYLWYLVMVNMPFFADKIDWGTSIRGVWWAEPPNGKITFESVGLWLDEDQLSEPMEFSVEQWQEFMAAVIEFAEGEK